MTGSSSLAQLFLEDYLLRSEFPSRLKSILGADPCVSYTQRHLEEHGECIVDPDKPQPAPFSEPPVVKEKDSSVHGFGISVEQEVTYEVTENEVEPDATAGGSFVQSDLGRTATVESQNSGVESGTSSSRWGKLADKIASGRAKSSKISSEGKTSAASSKRRFW
jgi:hypothetical protein